MKVSISVALVALLSTTEAFSLFGFAKNLFGLEPGKLYRAKGDNKDVFTKRINDWDGSILKPKEKVKTVRGEAKIKYYKPKKVEGKDWSRIYLKKGYKAYSGIYVETKCSDENAISSSTVKETMIKSLDQKKMYTIECGNKVKEGKRH